MSFLFPWMLAGLVAVGVPILIHLLNKFRVRSTDWGAMKLLLDSVKQDERKVKLDDLILLLLRKALDEAPLSDKGSGLMNSLGMAVDALASTRDRPKEIRIYTDGQR